MRYFLIILTITLFSCSNKEKPIYTLPNSEDINEIIETIIIQDSLPIFKFAAKADTVIDDNNRELIILPVNHKFSINLEKLYVYSQSDTSELSTNEYPFAGGVYNNKLINIGREENKKYFTAKDTGYFSFQNDTIKSFVFTSSLTSKIYTTSWLNEKDKKTEYLACSIPVFSIDKSVAYVVLTHHCYGLCGSADGYILVKKNGKWEIAYRRNLWIS